MMNQRTACRRLVLAFCLPLLIVALAFPCLSSAVCESTYLEGDWCRCRGAMDFDGDGVNRGGDTEVGSYNYVMPETPSSCLVSGCNDLVAACNDCTLPYSSPPDCDDNDAARYPGASEVCGDSKDNDCDGMTDENCNEAPVITLGASVSATMDEDGAWTPPTIEATDADGGDTLTWGKESGPLHGTAPLSAAAEHRSRPLPQTYPTHL